MKRDLRRLVRARRRCLVFGFTVVLTASAAESQAHTDPYVEAAIRSAEAAVAADNEMPSAELEQQAAYHRAIVDAAMRRIETSSDQDLADRLLLPSFVSMDAISTALSYDSAWIYPDRGHSRQQTARTAITDWYLSATDLFYQEWACDTGRHTAVAQEYVDDLQRTFTAYPLRMMLRAFIQERERLGFEIRRDCDRTRRETARFRYQQRRSEVLAL